MYILTSHYGDQPPGFINITFKHDRLILMLDIQHGIFFVYLYLHSTGKRTQGTFISWILKGLFKK